LDKLNPTRAKRDKLMGRDAGIGGIPIPLAILGKRF
jgi:hypothetical protein